MVASYVQLLERRYRGRLDQDADDFIGFAVEGATRMKTLINDLMAYSSVSRAEHEVGPVELRECVRAAMDRISSVIRSSEARVVCPEELPVVEGDRAQLTLLVENLLSNAIKFHGEARPEVRITAEQGEGEWVVSVRDNGMGIAPQQHERIFAVFQRLNPREHFPGNGIGLAICRRILERHGGRIWVESEPGRGSTFRFTLPLGVAVAAAGRRHTARL